MDFSDCIYSDFFNQISTTSCEVVSNKNLHTVGIELSFPTWKYWVDEPQYIRVVNANLKIHSQREMFNAYFLHNVRHCNLSLSTLFEV